MIYQSDYALYIVLVGRREDVSLIIVCELDYQSVRNAQAKIYEII